MWVFLRLSLILIKLEYQDSVGISTPVPQSNQNKYQDSVGISTLVPQSVKRNTRIVWVSLRLFLNLVKLTRIVWVSLRLSLNLVKLNTRIVWVSLRLSLNLVKLKYQDSVGISMLVPHSNQT